MDSVNNTNGHQDLDGHLRLDGLGQDGLGQDEVEAQEAQEDLLREETQTSDEEEVNETSTTKERMVMESDSLEQRSDKIDLAKKQEKSRCGGRRTQSLEILSDRFSSCVHVDDRLVCRQHRHHARFADGEGPEGRVVSPAFSAPPISRTLRTNRSRRTTGNSNKITLTKDLVGTRLIKSESIPVHLTITHRDWDSLPASLRRVGPQRSRNVSDTSNNNKTTTTKSRSRPNSMASRPNSVASRAKVGERMTQVEAKRATANKQSGGRGPASTPSSSFSSCSSLPSSGSVPSLATSPRSRTLSRPASRARPPPALNASLEIWQIQQELRRGEMVQGVLQFGGGGFGFGRGSDADKSGIRKRLETNGNKNNTMRSKNNNLGNRDTVEGACICAPVVIGRTDGHMSWRGMN